MAQTTKDEESLEVKAVSEEKVGYRVTIADPFIELHTGPSAGYPIFHVVERGSEVSILLRKTRWFKVETSDGKTGWVSREQMRQTLLPSGEQFKVIDLDEDDFEKRKWIFGVTGGEIESSPIFTLFGGYSFTENVSVEASFGQSSGSVSSSTFLKGNLVMQPLPDLKYSPYMTLGFGKVTVEPSSSLITGNEETSDFAQVGIGVQRYISRSFLFRIELNEYVIFSATSANKSNEVVDEWKLGFAVFY
ncbi:MAG: SH3 domain-containing protein [Gammaproteobacteria bacterium]|nr:SH3 domain-containing protein [Gammaproteobacteria bacterium]